MAGERGFRIACMKLMYAAASSMPSLRAESGMLLDSRHSSAGMSWWNSLLAISRTL